LLSSDKIEFRASPYPQPINSQFGDQALNTHHQPQQAIEPDIICHVAIYNFSYLDQIKKCIVKVMEDNPFIY